MLLIDMRIGKRYPCITCGKNKVSYHPDYIKTSCKSCRNKRAEDSSLVQKEVAMNKDYLKIWQSKEYIDRVLQLEEEGCTTSDAQGVADVEFKIHNERG